MKHRVLPWLVVPLAIAFASGCASTGGAELEELKSDVARAKLSAEEAKRIAQDALDNPGGDRATLTAAKSAQSTAEEAKRIAEQALREAKDALEAAEAANLKAERMFKKTMRK